MKRIFLPLLFTLGTIGLFAQDIVTNTLQNKAVILEEFTGIRCVFCPEGHLIAKELSADFPGRVVLVNVHAGSFAVPGAGQPDYRTDQGEALDNLMGISGYPSGSVNRRAIDNSTALSRAVWRSVSEDVLKEVSPVNVGARSTLDIATRTLTIDIEVIYVKDSETSTNNLMVAILQDSLIGPQTGAAANPDDIVGGQYRHGHMLREFLTGETGLTIPVTSAGTIFDTTIVYQIPDEVRTIPLELDDLNLAVYVSNTASRDIQHGITLGLDDENDGNLSRVYAEMSAPSERIVNSTETNLAEFLGSFTAYGDAGTLFNIELVSDQPSDWNADLSIDGTVVSAMSQESFSLGQMVELGVSVQPGSSGIGTYEVIVTPEGQPDSKSSYELTVIHKITELLVTGESFDGAGLGQGADTWQGFYDDAFNNIVSAGAATVDAESLLTLVSAKAMNGVNNVYLNVGWTFPAYTDNMVSALTEFMDAGGNVFIAGQDMAWDIMANTNPVASNTKRAFMRDYLNVDYVDDGGAGNNPVTANADGIFANVATFDLFSYYGSGTGGPYFYPDQVSLLNGSEAGFTYDNSNRIGAAYSDNGTSKVVYLGFGLEMIQDPAIHEEIMQVVYDYFYGIVDNEELLRTGDIAIFPNPVSNGELNVHNKSSINSFNYSIENVKGQKLFTNQISNTGLNRIDVSSLSSGVYFFNFATKNATESIKFVIE